VFPDSSSAGETGEERFFGLYEPTGISSIFISNSGGGIEVDHLQFGAVGLAGSTTTSPGPSTTTTTTTTTLAGTCAIAPTYESILCRLDELIHDVSQASDLARLKQGIAQAVAKARKQIAKAQGGSSKVAKNQLKKGRRVSTASGTSSTRTTRSA